MVSFNTNGEYFGTYTFANVVNVLFEIDVFNGCVLCIVFYYPAATVICKEDNNRLFNWSTTNWKANYCLLNAV